MEKGRKLKLKRKLKDPQLDKTEANNTCRSGPIATSNAHLNVEELVELSSESDGEEPLEKQKKTLQCSKNEAEQSDTKRHFLDVKDPELRKLRELIMKISGKSSTEKMTGFQSHLHQTDENTNNTAEVSKEEPASLEALVHRRISYEIQKLPNGTKLSPFPSMCDWCRRKRPSNENCCKKSRNIETTNQNYDLKKSVLNGNPAEMEMCVDKHDISTIKPLAERLHQKVDTLHKPDIKPTVATSARNEMIASKHLESDVISNQRSSLRENNSEYNNSHLMRDRNSNYYSLQSRNGSSRPTNSNTGNRETQILATNQRRNTTPTSVNKDCDQVKETKSADVDIPDLGKEMEDHDVSTFDLAFDSDSEMEMTEIDGESSKLTNHNQDAKFHKEVMRENQTKTVSKSEQQSRLKSTDVCTKQSGTRHNVDNQNRSHSQVHGSTSAAISSGRTNKVPVACVSPCISSENQVKSDREASIQNCPLCQMEFVYSSVGGYPYVKIGGCPSQKRSSVGTLHSNQIFTSQLEIDGHIAACLSAADDDVMW